MKTIAKIKPLLEAVEIINNKNQRSMREKVKMEPVMKRI